MPAAHFDRSILWSGYPSWRQFSWLYLMAVLVSWRAWIFWQIGFPGWIGWGMGALVFLATAAIIRRWAYYEIEPTRLVVRNGYTGHEISKMSLAEIERVDIRQGPVASFLGIGTVATLSADKKLLRFRGVANPEAVKRRIEAAIPTQ